MRKHASHGTLIVHMDGNQVMPVSKELTRSEDEERRIRYFVY